MHASNSPPRKSCKCYGKLSVKAITIYIFQLFTSMMNQQNKQIRLQETAIKSKQISVYVENIKKLANNSFRYKIPLGFWSYEFQVPMVTNGREQFLTSEPSHLANGCQ